MIHQIAYGLYKIYNTKRRGIQFTTPRGENT